MIISYNSYGQLKVLSKSGKIYEYERITPFIKNKLENCFKHKQYGKAWQILRQFKTTSIAIKEGID